MNPQPLEQISDGCSCFYMLQRFLEKPLFHCGFNEMNICFYLGNIGDKFLYIKK